MSLYEQLALLQSQITDLRHEVEAQRLVSKLASIPWTDYTVTWTAVTTNPAIESGTLTGRYCQVGKLVTAKIYMLAAADTTFGSGNWSLGLPVTAAGRSMGTWFARDSGTGNFGGNAFTTTSVVDYFARDGSNVFRLTATVPFTWANTDYLDIFIAYEAA